MAPILDANSMRLLFNPKYMDFKTCSSLRPVSSQFKFYASKYFLSIKEFDLSVMSKSFSGDSDNILYDLYSCLLGTLTKIYCPNLEKIVGIRIHPEKFDLVSRGYLQELPNLTSISVEDDCVSSSALFNFLKLLPRLRSVDVGHLCNDWNEDGGEIENVATPEEEKLAVQELSLKSGPFWHLFRMPSLKKLVILQHNTWQERDFFENMSRCPNIEQVEIGVVMGSFSHQYYSLLLPEDGEVQNEHPLVTMKKNFTVNLRCEARDVQWFMSLCPRLGAHVTGLTLSDTDLDG